MSVWLRCLVDNIYVRTNFAREFQTACRIYDVVSITRKSRSSGVMQEAPITRRLRDTKWEETVWRVLEHAQLAEDIIYGQDAFFTFESVGRYLGQPAKTWLLEKNKRFLSTLNYNKLEAVNVANKELCLLEDEWFYRQHS